MPDFVLAGLEDRHVVVDHSVLVAGRLQLENYIKVIVILTSTK
jgi:hypothetical protein